MDGSYDVVVVGGGAAGLSGALALSRARRSVLVVDGGAPRNAPAGHVHNYLGREGVPPAELLAAGRAEVESYGGEIVGGTVVAVEKEGAGFRVHLGDGGTTTARRVLLATGLLDELPDVPGLADRWGREVLHCPYCHGWEVRDTAIGVLATGPLAVHQALLWRQWSADVTLFVHTAAVPDDDALGQLTARGIEIVEGAVTGLEVRDDRLTGVRVDTGKVVPVGALVTMPRFTARLDAVAGLGLVGVPQERDGHVIGSYLPAEPTGATAVPGVYVAGNASDLFASVIVAAAAGLNTAAALNMDLVVEDTRQAVAHRHWRTAHEHGEDMFSATAWEKRYAERDAVWSGRVNPALATDAAGLTPGTALDVGAGEGADAVWLAERGWQVTAVDFSPTALHRGAAQARLRGVGDRITWTEADLTAWAPPAGAFDLVTAQYMHLPREQRQELQLRLAAAVAPGGTLLIAGHHPSDLQSGAPRPNLPDMFFTAQEVAALLDPQLWDVVATDTRPRTAKGADGQDVAVHDAVLMARRR